MSKLSHFFGRRGWFWRDIFLAKHNFKSKPKTLPFKSFLQFEPSKKFSSRPQSLPRLLQKVHFYK